MFFRNITLFFSPNSSITGLAAGAIIDAKELV